MALERTRAGLQALIDGLPQDGPDVDFIKGQLQDQIDVFDAQLERNRKDILIEQRRHDFATTVAEFKIQPHTPELTTRFWSEFWWLAGRDVSNPAKGFKREDIEIAVPDCGVTAEEIVRLEHLKEQRTLVYVPPELTTPEGLAILGVMFSGNLTSLNDIRDSLSEPGGGWLHIESNAVDPHGSKEIDGLVFDRQVPVIERDARRAFAKEGISGQRLATYIIGSEMSNMLTDGHFDRGSPSLLLGTLIKGRPVEARHSSFGLELNALDRSWSSVRSWRSEGRIQTA